MVQASNNSDEIVKIVDFGPFIDGSNKQAVADALLASFQEVGFVYLVNHGLSREKMGQMFEWSKKFFSQSTEVKQLAPHPASGAHHRGYSAPGLEKVTQYDAHSGAALPVKAPDLKESFESGREDDPDMPNIWLPEGVLPGFEEACMDMYGTFREVELTVLRALAIAFHLPEDYFTKVHSKADNQLRLLHYPSVPIEQLENERIARIGAHADFCSITLLLQDNVGGLEVEDPNLPGTFKSVKPVEDAIVLNAGDFLMRWSNDTIRSTVHRVRAPPNFVSQDGTTPERYSIPYFCSPDFDTVVDCIPGTYSEANPKKYEPISARSYIIERLAAAY